MAEKVDAPITEVKPEMMQPGAYAYPFAEPMPINGAYPAAPIAPYQPYENYHPVRGFFRNLFGMNNYGYDYPYAEPMYAPRPYAPYAPQYAPYAPQYAEPMYAPRPYAEPYGYGYPQQGYYNPHPVRSFFRGLFGGW